MKTMTAVFLVNQRPQQVSGLQMWPQEWLFQIQKTLAMKRESKNQI